MAFFKNYFDALCTANIRCKEYMFLRLLLLYKAIKLFMCHFASVDCEWTEWSIWEECSETCGNGSQSRSRNSTGPYFGGVNCTGAMRETQQCNISECPSMSLFREI